MNNSHVLAFKILIVADYSLVLAGLGMLLENQPDMRVVAMTGDRREALAVASTRISGFDPIWTWICPSEDVDDSPTRITRGCQKCSAAYSDYNITDPEVHRQRDSARSDGCGFEISNAQKCCSRQFRKVHAGEVWLDRTSMGNVLHEMTRKVPDPR